MGWIILIIIIVFICIVWVSLDIHDIVEGIFEGGLLGLMISIFVLGFLVLISMGEEQIINTYEEKQYNICGLENKNSMESNINARFFLGFGYVNGNTIETMKYYYFRVDENGKKLESIDGTNIYIRETNEQEPCLIIKKKEMINVGFWAWLWGEDKMIIDGEKILVVPEDTVQIEYNVNI